ncbi:MAG: hypothetical protein IPM46_14320 [Flavobacteriales bacterium]|nr:hypothetical protein [Flavobacteriales bacterium]
MTTGSFRFGDLVIAPPRPLERVAPLLREELCADVEERGQVTVHLAFTAGFMDGIRIWPSTYLLCRTSGQRSPLLHAEGIPHAPTWRVVPPGRRIAFTLLFAALPRACELFDLVEEIPEDGGFYVPGIARNGMDVYRLGI